MIKLWHYTHSGRQYYISTHNKLLSGVVTLEPTVKLIVDEANDVISKYNSLLNLCKDIKMTADENETFLFITGVNHG